MLDIPAREYEYGGVAAQCPCQDLGAINTETYTVILDGRNGGLRDAGSIREVVLAHFLKLTQDPNRLANRNFRPFSLPCDNHSCHVLP